jgi:L-amino acid N-acyltransferase YncA
VLISETDGYWTLQAQTFAANTASRALFTQNGYREVGHRERNGHVNGVWHDVVLLERRSARTGGPNLLTRSCGA